MVRKNWTGFLPVSERMLASVLLTPQDQLPGSEERIEQIQSYGAFNALPGSTLPIQVLVWRPRLVCCFLESFVKWRETLLDLFPGSLWKLLKSQQNCCTATRAS